MRDYYQDDHPIYGWSHGKFRKWVARSNQDGVEASHVEASMSSSVALALSDDTATVHHFLEDAGVIWLDEGPMTLWELSAYVRGRMMR